MDARDVMAAVAKVLGALLALPLVAFLLLVAINWNDEAPSTDAQRLAAMLRDRPALADQANGYVHARDLLGASERGYRDARSPEVAALAEACSKARDCSDALEEHSGVAGAWIASEQWLLDRYQAMLATEGWREEIPEDIAAPLPPYGQALEAQKLHLLSAWQHARAGDAAAVRDLLEQDLLFWRRTAASSDLLISKMIALAAAERHFALGNVALAALPAASAGQAIPPSWRQPVTLPERSLARALAGEWHFTNSALQKVMAEEATDDLAGLAGLPSNRLQRVVFKEQATRNLFAGHMAGLGRLSERPYVELGQALDALAAGEDGTPWLRMYNPVGEILAAVAAPAYAGYIARASDLEGQRRAALLAVELRAAGTAGDAVPAAMAAATLRNPYDDAPFEWDAAENAVVFHGLREGDRGRYALAL